MSNWQIDCATFVRLTGTTIGAYDPYWIGLEGVRDYRTAEYFENSPLTPTTEEAAVSLESIENAKLQFPTTAQKLVEWVGRQGGDFGLPRWFQRAVEAIDSDAGSILDEARAVVQKGLDDRAAGRSVDSASELRILGWEQSDLTSELNAIQTLQRGPLIASEPRAAQSPTSKAKRGNAVQSEVQAAMTLLGGTQDPDLVRKQMLKFAGHVGSVLINREGTLGYVRRGRFQQLDNEAIRKRIRTLLQNSADNSQ
jgi:hypothetical protein